MEDELDDLERQSLKPSDGLLGDESIPVGGADPWIIKPLEELITRLNFALSSILLYPLGHPVITESTEKIHKILESLLGQYPSIPLQFFSQFGSHL